MKIAKGNDLIEMPGSDKLSQELRDVETPGLIERTQKIREEATRNRVSLKYMFYGFLAIVSAVLIVSIAQPVTQVTTNITPLRSIGGYITSFTERNPESTVSFIYQEAIADLPGSRAVAYAQPSGEQAELVIFEFENDSLAQKAMTEYTQGMNAMIKNNLIIAAPSGELKAKYIEALNPSS